MNNFKALCSFCVWMSDSFPFAGDILHLLQDLLNQPGSITSNSKHSSKQAYGPKSAKGRPFAELNSPV